MDPIERLRFLAPGTSAREGGKKTQHLNRFPSHRVTPADIFTKKTTKRQQRIIE